jgi:hypothetical protein
MEQFVSALQEVDHDCLVVFLLRDDEFHLKMKLGKIMQQRAGYERKAGSEHE